VGGGGQLEGGYASYPGHPEPPRFLKGEIVIERETRSGKGGRNIRKYIEEQNLFQSVRGVRLHFAILLYHWRAPMAHKQGTSLR